MPPGLTWLARRATLVVLIGVLGATGCGGSDSGGGGTLIIAQGQDPETLFPPNTDRSVARAVTELLFEKLADLGPALNTLGSEGFQPRLAKRWDWSRDSLSVTFHLDGRARWQDGHPVRAGDVRFGFAVYTDTLVGSRSGADLRPRIDSISVADSLTCTAWFSRRTPENFYNLVVTLIPLPEHLLGRIAHDSLPRSSFARSPVGNGPYRFARWEPRQRVEIVAVDSFYRGRAKLDRVIWTIAPAMQTLVQQLQAGELDFLETLPANAVPTTYASPELRVEPRGSVDYAFLQLNLRDGAGDRPHPLFADRELRRAITRALDREGMVRSAFDSLGLVPLGPFTRSQWARDSTLAQLRFDRAGVTATLDSMGWRAGKDGMRSQGGRAFAFKVLVPTSSSNRQRFATMIQEQLRLAGIRVELESLDDNSFGARRTAHTFDAILNALSTSPSPSSVRQSWTSSGAREGGFNYGRYESRGFDAHVDSATAAETPTAAKAHYRAAYQAIIDDAPAVWLYEPKLRAGMHRRIVTGPLRSDAWWLGIPGWSIAPGRRLPRDAALPRSP